MIHFTSEDGGDDDNNDDVGNVDDDHDYGVSGDGGEANVMA